MLVNLIRHNKSESDLFKPVLSKIPSFEFVLSLCGLTKVIL